jgi:DNA-binding NtrC family response regulator
MNNKKNRKIVIIFSDNNQSRGIATALVNISKDIVTINNPIKAIDYIKTEECFLVITETEFNIIDGKNYLRELIGLGHIRNLIIIDHGADYNFKNSPGLNIYFIYKPININNLINKVKNLIINKEMT